MLFRSYNRTVAHSSNKAVFNLNRKFAKSKMANSSSHNTVTVELADIMHP